jgi:D-alanyl-D-alanine carboxypeptidase
MASWSAPRRTLRPFVAALTLGLAVLAAPAAAPSPALGLGPLPACRLDDILTSPRDYDSWSTTLVDTILRVGKSYVPPDLVPISRAGVTGGGSIRKVAIDDLRDLEKAAEADGYALGNVSSYRSYQTQVRLFNSYVRGYGYMRAVKFSARPGHSEHQLGLAIDFSPAGVSSFISGDSAIGRWMADNAWKYGWLLSYPRGKYKTTCYTYEPWHYRYVGRDLAAKIHDSGLTTREYLWANFTTTQVPSSGPGASAAPPTATASPTASLAATATAAPAPTVSAEPPTIPPTAPPASPAGALSGLDPPLVIAGVLLVLASLGLIASIRMGRRGRSARRRR